MKTSKNSEAERIAGLRRIDGNPIDYPCELGYHCPKCEYLLTFKGNYDERLEWSEYNGFLWCSVCNKDYPTALCCGDNLERATEVYLKCVEEAQKYLLAKQEE